ncbi:MAG: glycosyltransferase family 39 protein, partial [Flavobacteriales bacterium]|nr:glycosyltransferase family 39 protein [Flavobacteriales bacterium]
MPLWIRDIRFFILFAALIRLVNITSPPVEVGHNWRQSTGLMVARNFVEEKLDVFHPRVDMAGQLSGITGMEFPLLNAAHAAVSKVFGYEHWYGRLIVLLLSSWAMWSLYCLLKGVQNERMSRATIVVLTASLWFGYSRKIMPDVFSCSLVILGVHAFAQGWQSHRKRQWIAWSALGALAITAGLLSKLPSGILLAGFLPFLPVISGHWKCKSSLVLLLPGILGVLWWYFLWSPSLVENYGFWHFFMGKSGSEGWVELMNQPGVWAKHFYDHSLKFVGFAVFLF